MSAFAATTPPTMAAALEPRPRPTGIADRCVTWYEPSVSAAAAAAARADTTKRLSSPVGMPFPFSCEPPSLSTFTDHARAGRSSNSARSGRAIANESKPGPRFALDAGTRTRSSPTLGAERRADRVRRGVDLGDGAGERAGAVRVLHSVTGENAHDPLRAAEGVRAHALAQSRDRRGGRGLGENALAAGEEAVRVQDLAVAHRVDRAARFIPGGHRALPRRRIADPYCGRDGLGLGNGLSADERRRALRLVAVHPRPLPCHAGARSLDEALPVGRDVSGVPDGDEQGVGRVAEGLADLERGRFLALEPVRVHAVHQRGLA